jgi:hypothetical protein
MSCLLPLGALWAASAPYLSVSPDSIDTGGGVLASWLSDANNKAVHGDRCIQIATGRSEISQRGYAIVEIEPRTCADRVDCACRLYLQLVFAEHDRGFKSDRASC